MVPTATGPGWSAISETPIEASTGIAATSKTAQRNAGRTPDNFQSRHFQSRHLDSSIASLPSADAQTPGSLIRWTPAAGSEITGFGGRKSRRNRGAGSDACASPTASGQQLTEPVEVRGPGRLHRDGGRFAGKILMGDRHGAPGLALRVET